MASQGAQRRKGGKKAQDPSSVGSRAAGGSSTPAAPATKAAARKAAPPTPAAAAQLIEAPAALQAAAALAALVLLLFAHHAAVRLLAPQTGKWLASSFCSLAVFAVATAAAVLGHAAVEASALLPAGNSRAAPGGSIPTQWWMAAGSGLLIAILRPEQLAGSLLLAPGLADGSGRRITDAQLTLCAMGAAVLALGPLFLTLGCAAGACGSRVLRRLAPGSRPLLVVLPLVAGTAVAGMVLQLPAALLPPRPGSTLPPALGAAAAIIAAALAPRQADQRGNRAAFTAAAGAVAVAAALLAASLRQPCTAVNRQLQGGRYTVFWRCEMAAGGQLSVVEGTVRDQYRYRLLRLDHSVMGGEYVAPPEVAGQSVYSAFYLQQAAALLRPNGTRSLHVGLGIGTAVKAMQRLGVAADAIELHPEVLHAAQRFFGLQPALHGGRALVGDAAQLVPHLAAEEGTRYDYVLHDVFSGGGIAPPLMDRPFFRQLRSTLAPGGVLAVNYFGGRGASLKQAWCRLRLEFESVRAFSDIEQSRLRNHVLFASDADLAAVNVTAGLAAVEARAAAIQAAAATGSDPAESSAGGGSASSSSGQLQGQPLEVLDPLQLQVWRALPRQEVHLTYDRQRCQQLLELDGTPAGRSGGSAGSGSGRDGSSSGGSGSGSKAGASEDADELRRAAFELRAVGKAGKKAPLGKLGQAQRQRQQAQQEQQGRPPWVWRMMKEVRERHALAVGHWVAMRTGWSDAFWLG